MYVKSLDTSLVGPIPVSIIYYSIPRDNWCIYTISYYSLGKEYNNLYEDSCRFLNVRETMGFYQSNNPNNIFLDKNKLECNQITDCEYYINMSETIRISNIGLSILNLLIITIMVLTRYRLERLRQYPNQYVDNSIVNPLHIVVSQ